MARIGPTGYSFTLDSYNPTTNAIGAAQALDRIIEFNGINEEGMVVDLTALGDDIMSEGATGVSKIERIMLKGYIDDAATSAFNRIGRVVRRTDYPNRTLTATHQTGITQAIEVFPVINRLVPSTGSLTMFEATFAIGASAAADFVETGI